MFLQNTTYKNKMEEILEKKKIILQFHNPLYIVFHMYM